MNRLILIGNGFDLAHGLKTSYNDFMLWYIKDLFQRAYDEYGIDNELVTIRRPQRFEELYQYGRIQSVPQLIDIYYRKGFDVLFNNEVLEIKKNEAVDPFFKVTVKSSFFRHLACKCSDCGWVAIENEYYTHLKNILRDTDENSREYELPYLNRTLEILISELQRYLAQLPKPPFLDDVADIFRNPIRPKDGSLIKLESDTGPAQTMVLNFNYTATAEQYFKGNPVTDQLNYIHGQLNDPSNPLIFGFGDELDSAYLQMEEDEAKHHFLTFIKSFWYLRTEHYHELMRFIGAEEFQVFILGHSCGLSDRTMLNMIFEHENCRSIKIFYHQNGDRNNFTPLTQEIARHFHDKGVMRQKIAPFPRSSAMPQYNK